MYKTINRCITTAISAGIIFSSVATDAAVKTTSEATRYTMEEKIVILNDMLPNISYKVNNNKIKCLKSIRKERIQRKQAEEIKRSCGVNVSDEERKILERIVEAEAGGEDHKGKVLVANVVLNRVKSKQFPSNIRDVIFEHSGSVYQFSPICDGRYYSVNVSKDSKAAVDDALAGVDYSQGALYFMERAIADTDNAAWFDRSLTKLFRYRCHEFYV